MILPERNNARSRLGLLSVARFRGLIQSRGGTWRSGSKGTPNSKKGNSSPATRTTSLGLPVISEETREESSATSETSSNELQITTSTTCKEFDHALRLISSQDIDRNRVGVQRLMILTTNKLNRDYPVSSSFQVSRAIVYGGAQPEEELRNWIASFMSSDSDDDDKNDHFVERREDELEDDELSDDISIDSSTDEESRLRGKDWGVLHAQALRVISNALEQILSSDDATDALPIDFSDQFWQRVVGTLCHNVEWGHSTDVTGYSLKILRLLHTFEPVQVVQLLRSKLLPYIAHLEEYGKTQRYPLIESEASKLMLRAIVVSSTRIEI